MKNITAEIITVGDEILIGQILDTNSQWLSKELDKIGLKINRKTSIRDEKEAILNELAKSFERSNVIIMTGGLGPTKDDITKKTIAEYFDVGLIQNDDVLAMIEEYFESRGRKINNHNILQSHLPENCVPLLNYWGTASGMWFEHNGNILISMPGVPLEMKNIMTSEGLKRIQSYFDMPIIKHRTIRTVGIGESDLMPKIEKWEDRLPEHIKLAYLPRLGQVRLRLSGTGENIIKIEKELQETVDSLYKLIPEYIYGEGEIELEEAVGNLLKKKNLSLATAESCTGGFLAHKITSVPGSSAYFQGSIIAYSNEIKTNNLSVNKGSIVSEGAVSEAVVKQMAENVRKLLGSDIGLSTSGIAGPDGGSEEKPIGTVWVAIADENGTFAKKLKLRKERLLNIELSSLIILNLLRRRLTELD